MNIDGETALHFACRNGRSSRTARILLEFGADPTIKDKYGSTAMDFARQLGRTKLADELDSAPAAG